MSYSSPSIILADSQIGSGHLSDSAEYVVPDKIVLTWSAGSAPNPGGGLDNPRLAVTVGAGDSATMNSLGLASESCTYAKVDSWPADTTPGCLAVYEFEVADVDVFRSWYSIEFTALLEWSDLLGSSIYVAEEGGIGRLVLIEAWRSWADRQAFMRSTVASDVWAGADGGVTLLRCVHMSPVAFTANNVVWNHMADQYQAEHERDMAPGGLWDWDSQAKYFAGVDLIGDVAGAVVLELGCGGGQFGARLQSLGGKAVGLDLSREQLKYALARLPVVEGNAEVLPIRTSAVDVVVSAFGAIGTESALYSVLREVARVLRPGGRAVWGWVSPIYELVDEEDAGWVIARSYFDRSVRSGRVFEQQFTYGDWIEAITAAGLRLLRLVEPEPHVSAWRGTTRPWWDRQKMSAIPSTAVWIAEKS